MAKNCNDNQPPRLRKKWRKSLKPRMKDPSNVFESAKTLGHLIKAFRNNFEIAQDEMAYACRISQANLSAIENGRREVGPSLALKLSAFMGFSPDVILYPNGYHLNRNSSKFKSENQS